MVLEHINRWSAVVGSSALSTCFETLDVDYATAVSIGSSFQLLSSLIGFWNFTSACLLKWRTKEYINSTTVWSQCYAHLVVVLILLTLSYRSAWTIDCHRSPLDIIRLMSEGTWLVALLCCTLTQHVEIQRGPRLSTFVFWLIGVAGLSPSTYAASVTRESLAWKYVVSTWVAFGLSVCMLTWEGLRARIPKRSPQNVQDDLKGPNEKEDRIPLADEASILSWLGCLWIWPLLRKGRKQTLTLEDWPCIRIDAKSNHTSSEFETLWAEESTRTQPSLLRVLGKLIWKELIVSGGFSGLSGVLLAAANPLALYLFIVFLEQRQINPDVPLLAGALLALLIALVPFLEIVFEGASRSIVRNACVKIESALINVLYRRIFNRNSDVQVRPSGDVINQISSDIAILDAFMNSRTTEIHHVWVTPILLAFYIFFLAELIGVYTLIPSFLFATVMYGSVYWGSISCEHPESRRRWSWREVESRGRHATQYQSYQIRLVGT